MYNNSRHFGHAANAPLNASHNWGKIQVGPVMAQQRWICDLTLLVLPVFIVTPRKEQKVGQHEWIPKSGSCFTCPRFGAVTKFCKAHGGGKRCMVLGCTKEAEGSTAFCKAHGGGKRCSFQDGGVCSKGVHGGTLFCVAHGGGKRCDVAECTKSARGRTYFCVRHGGGKRCKSEGCGKSAQGSTDFCKAHGGGKRCSWGQVGSGFGVGGSACDKFARGKTGLCAAHIALVQDCYVHGGGTLADTMTRFPAGIKHEMVVEAAAERDELSKMADGGDSSAGWEDLDAMESMHPSTPFHSESISIQEGRVHGGSIVALLSGSVVSEN